MELQPVQRSVKYKGSKISQDRERRRIRNFLLFFGIGIVIVGLAIWLIVHFQKFNGYKEASTIDITNSDEHTTYYPYLNGYIKVAGDGVVYFDKNKILWTENFEMAQPIVDVCEGYIAVADMKTTDVYIYDESGLLNRITIAQSITDVEVSAQGVIAVATDDKESNFIELLNKDGKELITAKSIFSSSGYLMDIALSNDGSKLVAAFSGAGEGVMSSKVVFYDFSKDNAGEDMIVGGFNQYESKIITNVEFMEGKKVCAVGNNGFSVYDFKSKPKLLYENLEFPWQIQSLFFNDKNIGFIVLDDEIENNYCIKVYNLRGKLISNKGFDFAYNNAAFAGNNVLLYSSNDCEIYSFAGVKKFSYSFEDRIAYMLSCGNGKNLIYAKADSTQFIKLK